MTDIYAIANIRQLYCKIQRKMTVKNTLIPDIFHLYSYCKNLSA